MRWWLRLTRWIVPLALLPACRPPLRSSCNPAPLQGELGTICGFDHPEDLTVIDSAQLLLASGMRPGAGLWAMALDQLTQPTPEVWRIWPDREVRRPEEAYVGFGCREPPP